MKFLIAVDGSEHALKAIRQVLQLREGLTASSSLTLVNVHMGVFHSRASRLFSQEQVDAYMDEISEGDLASARELLTTEGVPFEVVKRYGEPAEQIVAVAREHQVDMIVMGAKGRGSMLDLLMGSIASKVSSASPVSVLLVK